MESLSLSKRFFSGLTVVVPRGRRQGHKRKLTPGVETVIPEHKPLTHHGLEKYVCAVIALYQEQKAHGLNHSAHPRGMGLRAYMGNVTKADAVRKRSANHDRAKGTLSDALKQKDADNINKYFMQQNDEKGFRDRLNHLLGISDMILRGDNGRMFELADFFMMELKNEGP